MNKGLLKKLILAGVVALAVALFFALDLKQYLSLAYLKASQAKFAALYAHNRFLFLGAYFAVYVLVTGFSLPGALVISLAGGAMFGLAVGVVVVSFASSLGATMACFFARFVLRDWVEARMGDRLAAIHTGVEREGAFYLFALRLVPLFPFFVINLAFGLSKMRLRTFYWVSQLGMLPGTIVFINAGDQIGSIDSLAGLISPGLIISFALLGVFPIAAKKALDMVRAKKKSRPQNGPTG